MSKTNTFYPLCCRNFETSFPIRFRILAAALPILQMAVCLEVPASASIVDLTRHVDPYVKRDNGFIGASAPFGMLQWGPDTARFRGDTYRGSYAYQSTYIRGFSLTHFHGAGSSWPHDVPMMPVAGALDASPVGRIAAYASAFSRSNEVAAPGYYRVQFSTNNLSVEMSALYRAGIMKLVYPAGTGAHMIFNPSETGPGLLNISNTDASITIDRANKRVTGYAKSGNFSKNKHRYTIYFACQFNRDFSDCGTWNGDTKTAGSLSAHGSDSAGYVTFDTTSNSEVLMKVGMSYVSVTNAIANISSEIPGWDLAAVKEDVTAKWNELLNRVQVTGGTAAEKRMLYTALYHSFMHASIFSDCNGEYIGFDHATHPVAPGHKFYANFSLWDTYRTQAPLLGFLTPDVASDQVRSLLVNSEQCIGGGLLSWGFNNADCAVMGTYPAPMFMASAYAFGARDFDAEAVRAKMVDCATNTNPQRHAGTRDAGGQYWGGLANYEKYGWVNSVSCTLEYCATDMAIGLYCKALGDIKNYEYFLSRAQGWKNLYNPTNGFIQLRNYDGTWVTPWAADTQKAYSEGNTEQYTWLVPHNQKALYERMGGFAAAAARMDRFTGRLNDKSTWSWSHPYYWPGNEHDMQIPWQYNWMEMPWKSQRLVREVISSGVVYNDKPGQGIPGDDDLGAMSAFYVWAALGMYPMIPGDDGVTVVAPLFPSIKVSLPNGKTLTINAPNASAINCYIQSMKINGQPSEKLWVPTSVLLAGGTLDFTVGDKANTSWGAGARNAPPSYDTASASGK